VERAAKQFNVEKSTAKTPMKERCVISAEDSPKKPIQLPYREVVGVLQYLAATTKPGVAYAASQLARVQANPGVKHWDAAMQALKWCNGTKNMGIFYKRGAKLTFESYVDSSFADVPIHAGPGPDGSKHGRKSTEGYVLKLGGAPINWHSRREKKRAYSSTEAEGMAAASATKDIRHKVRLAAEMGIPQGPVKLHIDNQPLLNILEEPQQSARTKYWELDTYCTRDAWQEDVISCRKVATALNEADVYTKPLSKQQFYALLHRQERSDPGQTKQ